MTRKPTVWINVGTVVIYGSSFDAKRHKHQSIQLIWGRENSGVKLNGTALTGPTIINSQIEHQIEMFQGWVLLVEPKSSLGQALSAQLQGEPIKSFALPQFSNQHDVQYDDFSSLLVPLFNGLSLPMVFLFSNENVIQDLRIKTLIDELDRCFEGDCIKPSSWKAADVSSQVALSESRFLHLFRKELGIAWRPYLLWRRMICAIQAVIRGCSATQAAHLAGFSDSAHLSRTFRKHFGMSMRQALTLFNKM